MAPFLTHLAIGERVWSRLGEGSPPLETYGTFLFGCLAPDVDKVCPGLEQHTTHFVGKEESLTYMWQRTEQFLKHQTKFLRAPFQTLKRPERAFVMGYVCHVATDESTARIALALANKAIASGRPLPSVDAMLTAMDPRYWGMARAPERIIAALESAHIPSDTLTFAPGECLHAMYQIILPQVKHGGGLESYLGMLRRQWQWERHGWISDAPDDPDLEAELASHRRRIEADLPAANRWIDGLNLERFMAQAVNHSSQCLQTLLAEEMNQ
jgi:hypothetical protein